MKRILLAFASVALCLTAMAGLKNMQGLKIYINPGHGGYTSNDRPIQIYPYPSNDTLGYWESKSNLYKGLHLYHILDSLGATPYLSRIKNTEADDRSLSGIAAEANNLGCDLFFSIHSNAGEQVNYPLMLYREQVEGTPRYPENVTLSKIMWKNFYSSQLPLWTHHSERVSGDLTFYKNMWSGGLGVLRTLYVVGLLSEGSMHEHRPEAHRLMNDDVCWLEAWHIAKSIMEFYEMEEQFVTGNVAGIVYDDHNLREYYYPSIYHYFGRDALAALNDAYIELLDQQGNVVQRRTTDKDWNGAFVFRNVAPGQYKLRASHQGYTTEETDVTVVANEVTYQHMPLQMQRPEPLAVTQYSPNVSLEEGVSCAAPLTFEFNYDIDVEAFEKAFTIEPAVDGYFEYTNSYHNATFTPEIAFEPDATYTVTIGTEARHTDKYCAQPNLAEPLVFQFHTLNRSRIEVVGTFPAPGGTVHYQAPSFEFRFDSPIQYSDIYEQISITDSKGNNVPVNKRTSKFNQLSNGYGNAVFVVQGNLSIGETYHVKLLGTLRDRESIPLVDNIEFDFTAIDAAIETEAKVFDDIESAAAFSYDADLTTGIGTVLPRCISSSTALFGKAAAKFSYKFTDFRGGEIVWNYTGDVCTVGEGDKLGMYVNGDFNNHELYVGVISGTDTRWLKLCDLDFLGWQYREVTVEGLTDGMTYTFAGLKMVQQASPITQQGAFSVDNISLLANPAGVSDITVDQPMGIVASPNPAKGLVHVSAPEVVESLELINAAGATVKRAAGATIDVSEAPAGIYLLRVNGDRTVRLIVE